MKQTGKTTDREHQVLLGFLYKFTQLVKWPSDLERKKSAATNSIGILGDKAFNRYLANVTGGHEAPAGETQGVSLPDGCYILFIGKDIAVNLPHILTQTRNRPILTVSCIEGFAAKGGMIEIRRVKHDGKINLKLRVNTKNAEACNLTLEKELLLVADHAEEKELLVISDHLH